MATLEGLLFPATEKDISFHGLPMLMYLGMRSNLLLSHHNLLVGFGFCRQLITGTSYRSDSMNIDGLHDG